MASAQEFKDYLNNAAGLQAPGEKWDDAALAGLDSWNEDDYSPEPLMMTDVMPIDDIVRDYNKNPDNPSYSDTVRQFTDWLADFAENNAAPLLKTKPDSELTRYEKWQRYKRYKEWYEKSPAPKWYKDYIVPALTGLDDVQDVVATAAAVARLAAIVPGPWQPFVAGAAAALSGTAMLLDVPVTLLSLAGGPLGLKKLIEDGKFGKELLGAAKGGNWKKALEKIYEDPKLKRALEKKGLKKLKAALPGIGDLLQAGQALETLTGRGLQLGPLMGRMSDLWWGAIEKVKGGAADLLNRDLPQKHSPIPDTPEGLRDPYPAEQGWISNKSEYGFIWDLRYAYDYDTRAKLGHWWVPSEDIILRKPTPMEYYSLRVVEQVAYHFCVPNGLPQEILFYDIIGLSFAMPWVLRYMQTIEWHKVAAFVLDEPIRPSVHKSEFIKNCLGEGNGKDWVVFQPFTRNGFETVTHKQWFEMHKWTIPFHIYALRKSLVGTWQGACLDAMLNGIGRAFAHMFHCATETIYEEHDPEDPTNYTPTTAGVSSLSLKQDLEFNCIRRFCEWGLVAPDDVTDEKTKKFLNGYRTLARATDEYPRFKDMRKLCFKYLGGFRFKRNGVFYKNEDDFKRDFPWIP